MTGDIEVDIRSESVKFNGRFGMRPKRIYLGSSQLQALIVATQVPAIRAKDRVNRMEFDGMKVFEVNADDYLEVGL